MLRFSHRCGVAARMLVLSLALGSAALSAVPAQAQVSQDQAAQMLIDGARRAYNEKNYTFAATQFRDFLGKFGGHREAAWARYGLALSLLEGPAKDYQVAAEQLQPLSGDRNFPDHPLVLYYLAVSQRGLGMRELGLATGKPQELPQRQAAAKQRFETAVQHFVGATSALELRAKAAKPTDKGLSIELEWAARSRCDLAEMELRVGKHKEALATAETLLKNAALGKSRYRNMALYYHGFAAFLLHDQLGAGRSLNQLAPFNDPVFGTHARYLLGRVHHLTDERKEASNHYEAVLSDHAAQKLAAVEALKQPDKFKNDPEEKQRLERLTRDPPPDHVVRATFHLAVMLYENGQFADALAKFEEFAKFAPQSGLLSDALLRQGYCRVHLKQFPDAIRILQPLADKEPRLADQALLWLAKAQFGAADPNNLPVYEQASRTALDTLRRAAERAQNASGADPDAKERRGEILLEMVDVFHAGKKYKEAAGICTQLFNEKCLPNRDEEVLQRQAAMSHLAGDYDDSDRICQQFQQTFPKSPLLPAVLFRGAENAYFRGLAIEKNLNNANRLPEAAKHHEEAAKRYQVVITKFPEFVYTNVARFGLALAYYHKGDFEKAKDTLETIPQTERAGDLAAAAYLLADCLIRLAPAKADDALAAGKMEEQLKTAAELLDNFIGGQPNDPQILDALLKLGLCHQRLASIMAQAPDKAKSLASARAAYEAIMQRFPKHANMPQAFFERARCIGLAGDKNGAINELQRFVNDAAMKTAPVAPMAIVHMTSLLRELRRAPEAVNILNQARQQHEGNLSRDPERASWIAVLQYHHALALKEAGKLPEARTIFEAVARQFAGKSEAMESALRASQCLREEGLAKLETARKSQTIAKKPEEFAAAQRVYDEGFRQLQESVRALENEAEQLRQRQAAPDIRGRMIYESAWGYRSLADLEIAATRNRLQDELLKKKREDLAKNSPQGQTPSLLVPPDVPLGIIPLQPAEQKTRAQYQNLIASLPDQPLAVDARFELAELLADRGEFDPAVKLLNEALDKEPSVELADKVRIRLGATLTSKKEFKPALAQFEAVANNPKSPLAGEGHYRAGDCMLQMGNPTDAIKHLVLFRDQPPFQNLPGVTDRALLRLGHAFAALKQWDQSRQAHEQVVGRFGSGPLVHDARYGAAWAWQNQKQFDNAVNVYSQVTAGTLTETAAKAQLQIGLCRLEQKRHAEAATALLVVPFTYDYPEWNAVALCEAARSFAEVKQHDQAEKLLKRVIRDHPESKWAQVAKDRLGELK